MKLIFNTLILLACTLISFLSCQKYDDSLLTERVDNIEGRVNDLEKQVKNLNTNIQTISSIVKALENEDRIKSIEPLADGSGYKIIFSKMGEMIIKNGEKPSISIEKGNDGIYYWIVDGKPLYNGSDKIPATVTPEFKIENGQLFYRLNNGQWTVIPGAGTGIGLVKEVTETDENVTLVLADGRNIVIPKVQNFALKIDAPYSGVLGGDFLEIQYNVIAGDADTKIKAICDNGFTAKINGTSESGTITISVPTVMPDNATVLVVAVNSKGQMSGKILEFEKGHLSLLQNTITVGKLGGEITLSVKTNMKYSIMIDPGNGWITEAPQVKSIRTDYIKFNVEPMNESSPEKREGKIYVQSGSQTLTYVVAQFKSGGKSDFESFNGFSTHGTKYAPDGTKTQSGWTINQYCMIIPAGSTISDWKEINGYLPYLCGLKNQPGELSSPKLEGGCGRLTIKYGSTGAISQSVGYGFKVSISNGTEVKEFEIRKTKEEVTLNNVYEFVQDVNLTGIFDIKLTNLCVNPHNIVPMKLRDGVGILSVEWTGYSGQ